MRNGREVLMGQLILIRVAVTIGLGLRIPSSNSKSSYKVQKESFACTCSWLKR